MKVQVVVVGRARSDLAAAIDEYERRAARYWKLEVVEVAHGGAGRKASPEAVKAAEEERILDVITDGLEVVALTRKGGPMSSRDLARLLHDHAVVSSPGLSFVIGGAFGLGAGVVARARRRVSLSSMTLTHEMARLVMTEQLYRAGTIIRGEPYHKA